METLVVLGMGSNLGQREQFLSKAIEALCCGPSPILRSVRCSELFESDALLLPGSPSEWNIPFFNLAVAGLCSLAPDELLQVVKRIEVDLGRQDRQRWAPREIDIDILTFGSETIEKDYLKIPHPGICKRPFALWPLAALCPTAQLEHAKRNFQAQSLVHRWGYTREQIPCKTWRASRTKQILFQDLLVDNVSVVPGPLPCVDLVGIVNITPDSFSDGGTNYLAEHAAQTAARLFLEGAQIIDFGAESTRPKAASTDIEEEKRRLIPALEATFDLFRNSALKPEISIDTRRPEVLKALLHFKLDWINDVEGCKDLQMRELARQRDLGVFAMHSLGIPPSPQHTLNPAHSSILQINEWAANLIAELQHFGFPPSKIVLDPGIGFGKSIEQNWELIANAGRLKRGNTGIIVGHSRKSFLSALTAAPAQERDSQTALVSCLLAAQHVDYLRVHDVALNMKALCLCQTPQHSHRSVNSGL